MRITFIKTLLDLAEQDPRILLLTGDLGYMVVEPFIERFPDRFYNMGVAEQNMIGVATGLAEAGFIPFVYSIVNFSVLRPFEFIRNGPILHRLPVRIIGVGGGIEYANNGATHYGLEDVGLLRTQPGIHVIAPADYQQASQALLKTWDLPGPVYYRLGKSDQDLVPGLDGRFDLEQVQMIREGQDVLFLTLGNMALPALAAADILQAKGLTAAVAVAPCLNPAPQATLAALMTRFPLVLTVEAHYIAGGLGSLAAEIVAENGISTRLVRCGLKTLPDGQSGSQAYMYEKFAISPQALAATAVANQIDQKVL